MRDVLLSGTAGFLFSCTGAFIVHRALWKAADTHAQELDAMVGNINANGSSSSSLKLQVRRIASFPDIDVSVMHEWHTN